MSKHVQCAAIAMVATAVLVSGCATHRGSKTTAKVGGVTMLVGGVLAGYGLYTFVYDADFGHDENGTSGSLFMIPVGLGMLSIGAVLGLSGLIGMSIHAESPTESSPLPGPTPEPTPPGSPRVCFDAARLDGTQAHFCYPDAQICRAWRELAVAETDVYGAVGECEREPTGATGA